MEKIFRFFAERHLLATIFTLMILILGIVTTMTIRRDLFPRVELDQALITTVYPGASPEDVELNVTNKIETRLKSVSGIKELTSISIEDMSIIFVIPDPDLSKNAIDNVIQDIRESVSQVPRLPKGLLSPPVVSREKMSEIPILEVGIASDKMNYSELRESARIMEKKLKEINGVSKIEKYGYLAREIKIEIDPKKLEKFEVPLREIIYAIQSRNIRSTGGTLESYTGEKNIVALAQFRDPAEVGEVIVRSNFEGYALKVKNLASIKDGFKKEDVVSRINGKKMITFSINKRESADIVSTVNRIKDFLEKEKMDLPSHLEIHYSNDLSRYVTASFDVVFKNGLMGFFLVLIILTIFLSFRTSFWVALGIPVSLLGSIALLPLFGVGLDVITLTAMILVLGIIVDDAIIISETIYQRWEAGDSPVDAAVNGLKRVFLPVVTTILTTFLAFIPMFFIKGELGKFIYVIPLVITLALSISLLEGIIALPAHVANAMEKPGKKSLVDRLGWGWLLLLKDKYRLFLEKIVKPKEKKQDGTRDWFSSIRSKYEGFMHSVLKRRYYLASIFIALLVGSIIYAVAGLKIIVFPSEGAEEFVAYMETPIGTPVDKTSLAVKKVEDIVNTLSRDEVSSYMTLIGNQEGAVSQSHIAMIRINLTPFSTRSRNAEEIANELREKSLHLKDFSSFRFDVKESGPSPEKPVSIRIIGSNNELRKKLANDVEVYLKSISGVRDVTRDDKDGKEQVEILFDYAALARMGMTVIDAAQTIRVAYDGEVVTRVQYDEEETEFRVMLPAYSRKNLSYLKDLSIPNAENRLIKLKHVAKFKNTSGPSNFIHFDNERTINVQANVDENIILPEDASALVLNNFNLAKDYPGLRFKEEGAAKKKKESLATSSKTFAIAVLAIYFLMVILFNSLSQPLMVLSAVPFGFIGVIFTFAVHNEPLSFMAMLGIIGLSGVVVNDSLVLVDHLNKEIKENNNKSGSHKESLFSVIARGTADRLRPILMTTITTAAGLIPLAYGIGGTDPTNAPMALALGWGLVLATPLTLMLLPCLYVILDDVRKKVREFVKV